MVQVTNDGKGKHQSWQARSSMEHIGGTGSYSFEVVGWGASEDEARENHGKKRAELLKWVCEET